MKLCINFNSGEAFYTQLINQTVLGIVVEWLREGDSLPSVRRVADLVGISMHTTNKAYATLHQEGFIELDRWRDAVISTNVDRLRVIEEMKRELSVYLMRGICSDVSHSETHQLVDGLCNAFSKYETEE